MSRRSPAGRHGRHVYSATHFGFDDGTIDDDCDAYLREYRIPDETAMLDGTSPATRDEER